jgi:superfamily II DNA/RNA helicase
MRFKKSERADVLVATDVAAKGLDFPDVQQVSTASCTRFQWQIPRLRHSNGPAFETASSLHVLCGTLAIGHQL